MIYLAIPLALVTLWVFFLAYIQIKETGLKNLRWEVRVVAVCVMLVGGAYDVFLNWTLGLILGLNFGEWTLSQKCARLRKEDMGWRGDVAEYLCTGWLSPFDPDHC